MEDLYRDIRGATGDWFCVMAVLGPPGAGKSTLLERARDEVRSLGVRAVYVDLRQARDVWRVDEFYAWLFGCLRDQWDSKSFPARAPRVSWCDRVRQALGRRNERVLLIFDHLESIADWCARDLMSDLREIQDRSDNRTPWNRLRCVVAGTASVYDLRRRANSPNLQFVVRTVPPWAAEDALAATERYFADGSRVLARAVLDRLVETTRGELSFLTTLAHHLNGPDITPDDVERAVQEAITHAARYPELSRPAWLYQLDEEFRRRADDLIAGRAPAWVSPVADVDRYQLDGALVIGNPRQRQARFRNVLVERSIRAISAGCNGQTGINLGRLLDPTRLLQACREATSMAGLVEGLRQAWSSLSGLPARPAVLLQAGASKRRFVCDATDVSLERIAPIVSDLEGLDVSVPGGSVHVTRADREWLIDAEVRGREGTAGVRLFAGEEFVPSVSSRELLRLWYLFVQPLQSTMQRLGVQTLGVAALTGKLPDLARRVFVSSTYRDLREHRRAVMEQIVRRDLLFRGMEYFGADAERLPPAAKIVEAVRAADVYLGIFGVRYGSVDPRSGLSMTELEFNEAEARRMPMLLYVLREDAEVKKSDIEDDADSRRKLDAFLKRIKAEHTVCGFGTAEELATRVYEDLGKLD